MADDKIIQFPTDKIVRKPITEPNPVDDKFAKKVRDQQTRQFVEAAVDDISMNLLKQLYDMAVKTDKATFTKDLALIVDMIRGLIYRDFDMKHPSQILTDKMVSLNVLRDGSQTAKIDYAQVIEKSKKTSKPMSEDLKNELNDLNETGIIFEPDGNLDD